MKGAEKVSEAFRALDGKLYETEREAFVQSNIWMQQTIKKTFENIGENFAWEIGNCQKPDYDPSSHLDYLERGMLQEALKKIREYCAKP